MGASPGAKEWWAEPTLTKREKGMAEEPACERATGMEGMSEELWKELQQTPEDETMSRRLKIVMDALAGTIASAVLRNDIEYAKKWARVFQEAHERYMANLVERRKRLKERCSE
ncbi:hypothetical protein KJ039_07085 [bacterium]|nr:hypothetical protein [bacterium]